MLLERLTIVPSYCILKPATLIIFISVNMYLYQASEATAANNHFNLEPSLKKRVFV